jgi:tetracenomycin F1 monooxygenase
MSDELSSGDSKHPDGVVFINTFHTPGPEGQAEVLQSLVQITQDVIRHQPGFLSATLHQSLDGKTVTNVARWRSPADLRNALNTPGMLAHREVLGERYPREGYLGQVVYNYSYQENDPNN